MLASTRSSQIPSTTSTFSLKKLLLNASKMSALNKTLSKKEEEIRKLIKEKETFKNEKFILTTIRTQLKSIIGSLKATLWRNVSRNSMTNYEVNRRNLNETEQASIPSF